MSYGLGTYRRAITHTASKEQILLMLYEAAMKHCQKAIEAIDRNDIAKKGEHIGKLQDILIELRSSFNQKIGGQISEEILALYDYMFSSTTEANVNIDKAPLESVAEVLSTLYDAWKGAIKLIQANRNRGSKNV